jgi:hypothetical protein
MIPTVAEVQAEIQSLLGDEEGRVFTATLALVGYKRAYRYLREAMIKDQIPRAVSVATFTLPAGTTVLTPAEAGITDFGELIEMGERTPGTTDNFFPVIEADIDNGQAGTTINTFEWREDAFYFYGATSSRELRIRYYDSGTAPESGSVGIDGCLDFLAHYGAASIGPGRGYDDAEIQRMRREALGPNLDGSGGLLFNLLQPMVRSLQRVQRQPQPYSAGCYTSRRSRPSLYIAAPPTTEGLTQILTISGTLDGENNIFTLSQLPARLSLYNNGIRQYENVAYTLAGTVLTFLPGYIPSATDLLLAEATV